MFIHKQDKNKECASRGQLAETRFKTTMANMGKIVEETTTLDNKRGADFLIDSKTKIEVKAMKKVSRQDAAADQSLIWVEITGVSQTAKHKHGWLSKPKELGGADYIAFEQENSFIIVDRQSLWEYVQKKCDLTNFVVKSKDALYKSYRRWNNPKEHLSLIKNGDLKNTKHWVIPVKMSPSDSFYIETQEEKNGAWKDSGRWSYSQDEVEKWLGEMIGQFNDVVIKKRP